MDGEIQIQKAYESILSNDFEGAIEWFEKAIAAEPDNASYHYKLSFTYARNFRISKALQHAETASTLEPENETYLYHLTTLKAKALVAEADKYLQQTVEQFQTAVALLKQAAALDPLSVEAQLGLAAAYAGIDDYSSALVAVKEALRLNPQHELAAAMLEQYRKRLR
ncbi:tetratricopeptide repeat protein [Paenibacillus sp. FJAT-26967]|uniref:tetratricopeptide repeat protein n=1 Tax=Paenibacillus sp. FJAT-26967 TaxID=1729690 RepID=UPI000838908F|nr:tetratricopeptide repeat protein [Paenibacillus sp. FJAT-26967]